MCLTANGINPPRFIHETAFHAVQEAKRLSEQFDTDVKILKVIGEVKRKEVPVTKKVSEVNMMPGHHKDDLPF